METESMAKRDDVITLTRRDARDLIRAIEIISETAYRRGYHQGFVQHRKDHYAGMVPTLAAVEDWRSSPVRRRETAPPESGMNAGDPPAPARPGSVTIEDRMTFDMPRRVRLVDGIGLSSCDVVRSFIEKVNGGGHATLPSKSKWES